MTRFARRAGWSFLTYMSTLIEAGQRVGSLDEHFRKISNEQVIQQRLPPALTRWTCVSIVEYSQECLWYPPDGLPND